MLSFVRVSAGSDPEYESHLAGVIDLYLAAFPFNAPYAEKIRAFAAGAHPPRAEAIVLAALQRGRVIAFSVTFVFRDLKAAYLDYIASDPKRSARGLGAALYETTRDEVRNRGATRLYLDSLPDEPQFLRHPELLADARRRLAFYERLGARPIMGTAYETTVTPANLGDPNMLLLDDFNEDDPPSRRHVRAVMARILAAKCGLEPDAEPLKSLLASVKDDPVAVRPPRYPVAPAKLPKVSQPIDVVVTADEAPSIAHSPFRGYYERPARVSAIRAALAGLPVKEHAPQRFDIKALEAIHDRRMIAFLKETRERIPEGRIIYPEIFPIRHPDRLPRQWEMRAGYFCIDTSTPLTNKVYDAARRAADAALTGARLLSEGRTRFIYAVVRPPGHHAERSVFGGFCYFNNAAAAAHALSRSGRTALLDVDHHHGNGAQDIFYERADVLTVSIHGHPETSYPFYAGFEDERGRGPGEGFNVNYPLRPGVDDAAYLSVLAQALSRIRAYDPRWLVVCLGADIMRGDPTGGFFVTPDGMGRIGAAIGALGLPTLVVQEGGYNLPNLRRGARAFMANAAAAHERLASAPSGA